MSNRPPKLQVVFTENTGKFHIRLRAAGNGKILAVGPKNYTNRMEAYEAVAALLACIHSDVVAFRKYADRKKEHRWNLRRTDPAVSRVILRISEGMSTVRARDRGIELTKGAFENPDLRIEFTAE